MKYLNGEYYVEVKDHQYKIHATENIILRKREAPTSLRTQYRVQNETKTRRNQKIIKNDNDESTVKKILKTNIEFNNNLKLLYQIVLLVRGTVGLNLLKFITAKNVIKLSTNKNIKLIKKFVDKIMIFLPD